MNWFVSFLFAILRPALGLIILAGLLLYWVLKKKFPQENFLKFIIYIFSGAIIFQSIFSTILNWWLWSKQGITQQLLPPHSPIAYVLKYSWQHYLFEPVITILSALIIFKIITSLNKKFNNVFFYDEEPYLAALGILTTGWPNCLIYLSLVLFLGMVFHFVILCFYQIINWKAKRGSLRNAQTAERAGILSEAKKSEAVCASSKIHAGDFGTFSKASPFRLSLLYFWLPSALLVLFLSGIISKYIGITQLSI
ncbi:hypothetical protein GW950_01825 [Candidatus Wolfebacteria bacterium]|nr:hypothetical protein [Candidatus Wolfebacteria bacterium]